MRLKRCFRMENIDLFQIISEVFPLVGAENAHCQAKNRPDMHHLVTTAVMFAQFMNLGMAVMATGNTIRRLGVLNLLIFETTILQTLLLITGLEKTAATTATIVVGTVGNHVDKIFLTDDGFHHKPQVFSNGIAKGFTHDLTRVLSGKLDFQVLVPVCIDLELAFANPFGIIFIDVFNLKIMLDVKFFQSCQD